MSRWSYKTDKRGVSEVFGTILVISLVLVTSLLLVGVGMMTMQELTQDTEDDLAQEAILKLGDNIDQLSDSSVDEATTMVFPEGTGADIDTEEDQGKVKINVTTVSGDWDKSNPAGEWIDAPKRTRIEEIDLGSIIHEDDNGVVTAYQGGAVWREEDGNLKMLSEPNMAIEGGTLQLGFVNISNMNLIQEGQEITIRRNTTASQDASETLTRMIREHMTSDGDLVAEAVVTITVESKYAEGWRDYVVNQMGIDSSKVTLTNNGETVEIIFGRYGDSLMENMDDPYFDDYVVTSAPARLASDITREKSNDGGEIEQLESHQEGNDGFEKFKVNSPTDYKVGVWHDHDGDGDKNWWVWDDSSGKWRNIEDPDADPQDTKDFEPAKNAGSQFEIRGDTMTCVVRTDGTNDEFRDFIPSESNYQDSDKQENGIVEDGCLQAPMITTDDTTDKDLAANYEVQFEVTGWQANILNDDGKPGLTVNSNEELEFEVTVENTGTKEGTENVIALFSDGQYSGTSDSELLTYYQDAWSTVEEGPGTTLEPGDSETFTLSKTYSPTLADYQNWKNQKFTAGFITESAKLDDTLETFELKVDNSQADFKHVSTNIVDGVVNEGQEIEIEATFEVPSDKKGGERTIVLRDKNDDIRVAERLELDPGEQGSVTLKWDTSKGQAGLATPKVDIAYSTGSGHVWQEQHPDDVEIKALSNDPSKFVVVDGPDNEKVSLDHSVIYEKSSPEEVTVDATIKNEGTKGSQLVQLIRKVPSGEDKILDSVKKEIKAGKTKDVSFSWNPDVGHGSPSGRDHELYIKTYDNDKASAPSETVTVKRESTDVNYEVTELELNPESTKVNNEVAVRAKVKNTGSEDADRDYKVWALSDSRFAGSTSLELDSGEETGWIEFKWSPQTAGTKDVKFQTATGGEDSKELVVDEPDENSANFVVSIKGFKQNPVVEQDELEVQVEVTNVGKKGTQDIVLESFGGDPKDVREDQFLKSGETTTFWLSWQTRVGEAGTGDVTVKSEDTQDTKQATIKEKDRDPVNVAFAIDETGSMDWNDPSDYRANAIETGIQTLDADIGDQASLIQYSTNYCSGWGCGQYEAATTMHQLSDELGDVQNSHYEVEDGNTDIVSGLKEAEESLSSADDSEPKAIVLLTDGKHNSGCGGWFGPDCEEELKNHADDIDEDIDVYTVAFGNYNEDVLDYVATEGGSGEGKFVEATPSELETVFEDIVNEITKAPTPEFKIDTANDDKETYTVKDGDPVTVNTDITNVDTETEGERIVGLQTPDGFLEDSTTMYLGTTETQEATFTLDTGEFGIDWDNIPTSTVTKQVTIYTPHDTKTIDIVVEEKPEPAFDIQDGPEISSPSGDIYEDEEITVTVDLKNVGDAEGTKTVTLVNATDPDNKKPLVSKDIKIDKNTVKNDITFTWRPKIGEGAQPFKFEIQTDGNTSSVETDILPYQKDSPTFEITGYDTNADPADNEEITAGQSLNVNSITIKNTGDTAARKAVELRAKGETRGYALLPQEIPAHTEMTFTDSQITLVWDTVQGDESTNSITLATSDKGDPEISPAVNIAGPAATNPDFVFGTVSTVNDDTGTPVTSSDPLIAQQDTLRVTAEIENTGDPGTRSVELVYDGDIQDATVEQLNNGESTTVTFLWEDVPIDLDKEKLTLRLNPDSSKETKTSKLHVETKGSNSGLTIQNVQVKGSPSPDPTDPDSEITAGSKDITFEVTVENGGTKDITDRLFELRAVHSSLDISRIVQTVEQTISPGTKTFEMTWKTEPREGLTQGNWELEVRSRSKKSSSVPIYLNPPEDQNADGPVFGDDGSPIGIDIEDIEIS